MCALIKANQQGVGLVHMFAGLWNAGKLFIHRDTSCGPINIIIGLYALTANAGVLSAYQTGSKTRTLKNKHFLLWHFLLRSF